MLPLDALAVPRIGLFRFLLLVLFLGAGHVAFSQQKVTEKNGITFRIQKPGNTYTEETVIQTLEHADLRFHRFRNASNVLLLDDFTEIEILSAETLAAAGYAVDAPGYRTAYPPGYQKPTFGIKKYILLEPRTTKTSDKP